MINRMFGRSAAWSVNPIAERMTDATKRTVSPSLVNWPQRNSALQPGEEPLPASAEARLGDHGTKCNVVPWLRHAAPRLIVDSLLNRLLAEFERRSTAIASAGFQPLDL